MTLQEKIKLLRKERGLKIVQVAEKAGVSTDAVSRWENGERIPYLDNLIALSDIFDVSLDVFRQDATRLDLSRPNFKFAKNKDGLLFTKAGTQILFDSFAPDEKQAEILSFCDSYLETLDSNFFVKGAAQNSVHGTGRYFWEKQLDFVMFIGLSTQLKKNQSEYAFSVCTEVSSPIEESLLSELDCKQISDGGETWIYAPIRTELEKTESGKYPASLREAADNALFTAMKASRKILEDSINRFLFLKATENHTKTGIFETA